MAPSSSNASEIQKCQRLYLMVGIILFCCTGATVAVATIPWLDFGDHGFDTHDAVVGLLIAGVKASLVAAIFMHLAHERRLIYVFIGIGVIHAVGLAIGIAWHFADITHDPYFYHDPRPDRTPVPEWVTEPVAGVGGAR